MKKYLLLLLALLLTFTLVFTFASCGGDGDDDDDDDTEEGGDNEGGDENTPPTASELAALPFNDKTVTYNGSAHSVTVGGNKPTGVTVQYVGNTQINAGEYTVTAKFYYNGTYVEGADRTAKLTINKADIDMSGISFTGSSKVYDGTVITPGVTGTLPEGVSVTYDTQGKELKNAGEYTVTANFTVDGNHNSVAPLSADFVITKATYDTTDIFKSKIISFDGQYHSITVNQELPAWLTVSYNRNNIRSIGTYVITATFSGDPNNVIIPDPVKAVLTISLGSYVTPELTYEKLEDDTYAVTGYTGSNTFVVIPAKHEGVDVTSIKSSAFEGNTALEYVFISNSVKNIGNKAFKGCTSLNELRLSNSLEVIGAQAFANAGLKSFTIPERATLPSLHPQNNYSTL